MYQRVDGPIGVYNKIDNRISMSKLIGSYYDRCVLWTRMDRMSGTKSKDWSFNAKDGTIVGASWSAAGKFNHCLYFDGADDYISIPYSTAHNIPNWTVTVWINADRVTGYQGIVTQGNSAGTEKPCFNLALNSAKLYSQFGDNVWPGGTYTGNGNITAGKWYYVTITADGSFVRFYINGSFDVARVQTDAAVAWPDVTIIGAYDNAANFEFKGFIDEVQVYGRVLTADEIRKRYEIGRN